ncbi:MAG: hypothetical protein JO264_03060 [Acidisphaera sp.]|nr:hypothetical protein [Acidisphaera sp.]
MSDAGRQALARIDDALEKQPDPSTHEFAQAIESLVVLREDLIRRYRTAPELRGCLDRLNSALSVVVGSEYPLPSVRWDRVKQARAVLAQVVEEMGSGVR